MNLEQQCKGSKPPNEFNVLQLEDWSVFYENKRESGNKRNNANINSKNDGEKNKRVKTLILKDQYES